MGGLFISGWKQINHQLLAYLMIANGCRKQEMPEASSKPKPTEANRLSARSPRPTKDKLQRLEQSLLQVDPELLDHIRLVVQLLIDTGIDITVLQHHLERAYVLASSRFSKFRNKKPNQSGIAAMTGLSRAEVKRVLDPAPIETDQAASVQPRGVNRVIHGWHRDPEFSKDSKNPRVLARGNGPGTFDALVNRYGSDIPVAAVLRELKRRKYVKTRENLVSIESPARGNQLTPSTRRFLQSATSILESLTGENGTSASVDTQYVNIQLQGVISQKLLKAHLAKSVPLFFEQARIAANGLIAPPSRRKRTIKGQTVRLELISLTNKSGDL